MTMCNVKSWKRFKQDVLSKIGDFSVVFTGLSKQRSSSNGWVTAVCPFHEDRSPSFSYNRKTGHWKCHAGCGKGSVFDYLMRTSGKDFKEVLLELGDQVGVPMPFSEQPQRPPIPEELVKQWVTNLWANEQVCSWLQRNRGLTEATLKRYQIGWEPKRRRVTIPIRDERGLVVNVRLYSAKRKPKHLNYTDSRNAYGSPPRLFGLDELVRCQSQQVIVCEGEWDRLLLQQHGFMAVTGTHGAATFRPEWSEYFKNKDVVILYDCDPQGKTAATDIVLPILKASGAHSVKNVILPLAGEKQEKDVTDFLHKCGSKREDLENLIDGARACSVRPEGARKETASDVSNGTDQIQSYLVKTCKWIGPKVSRCLVRTYGKKTLAVCTDHPERVAMEIPGLTLQRACKIAATLREER